MVDNQQVDEADTPNDESTPASFQSGVVGGIIRSVGRSLRTLSQIVRSFSLGNMPMARIPLNSFGQTADQLGQLWELRSHIKRSFQKAQESRFHSSLSRLLHIAYIALPEMLKSTILGTVLFTVYDQVNSSLPPTLLSLYSTGEALGSASSSSAFSRTQAPGFGLAVATSLAAGSLGGGVHGLLHFLWDWLHHQLHSWTLRRLALHNCATPAATGTAALQAFSMSLSGTVVSHSLSHAVLFGSYEGTHRLLLATPRLLGGDEGEGGAGGERFPMVVVLSAAAAGATAGAATELAGHYSEPLETEGLRRGIRTACRRSFPGTRFLLPSLVPSALGFLAYELAKL